MKRILVTLFLLAASVSTAAAQTATAPLRVGIVGLVHDHVRSFLGGGALVPAGGILNRPDVQVVGIVEPSQKLFDAYAQRYHLAPSLHFNTIAEMVAKTHPRACLVFTPPSEHRRVVEECARLGVNVLMEKPLAFKYSDALAMQRAAAEHHIHVLVDYETTWGPGNVEAARLLTTGELGPLVRAVVRDGHEGPKKIGVAPEFLNWLRDPALDGDGALTDFGCYGPDLITAIMHGEVPQSVFAVTHHLQPEDYPLVDDDAEILLDYKNFVGVIEASWDWTTGLKQMDLYGRTGYAKSIDTTHVDLRKQHDHADTFYTGPAIAAPYDDPLHYLEAVLNGSIQEGNSQSSLKTNVTVAEILDAALQSAKSGKVVKLPLPQ